ncbi:metallophosphoesterase family protein [Tumebacillus lipolyticus]|uniref:Metallophosphoesterase family protein n=1 Tax=Tumebacillus lipolyticus TaxID=1280370 RepID=A0ABW5A1R8_9BACL
MRRFLAAFLSSLMLSALLVQPNGLARESVQIETPLLKFAAFSDTHVMDAWNIDPYKRTHKFTHALRDIKAFQPDFLVINGDLSNGREQDLKRLKSILKANGNYRLFPSMGNHEYYYQWENSKWNDEKAKAQFQQMFGLKQLYYDHFEKGAHFIHLSPEQYMPMQKQIGEAAWLSDKQIEWFEKTLLASQAPTFVFLHQPLDNTVGKTDPGVSAVQTEKLLAIAKRHPQVVWFSGHSHVSVTSPTEVVEKEGITFVGLGSVYQPIELVKKRSVGEANQGESSFRVDQFKSESRFVTLYRDRIVIRARLHHNNSWGDQHVIRLKRQKAVDKRLSTA